MSGWPARRASAPPATAGPGTRGRGLERRWTRQPRPSVPRGRSRPSLVWLGQRILLAGGDAMTERRRALAARMPDKIKQLEARLAQVEADLARVRSTAARGGLTRVKLAGIEKAMA